MIEQKGYAAPRRVEYSGHTDQADKQREPQIAEYERPEGKHSCDTDGFNRHMSRRNLPRDAHKHSHHGARHHSRNTGLQRCHPLEQTEATAKQVHQHDAQQQYCQNGSIDRPSHHIPTDRTNQHLQQHANGYPSAANPTAFSHPPVFAPHLYHLQVNQVPAK